MPKAFRRAVSLLVISCLMADPVTAGALTALQPPASTSVAVTTPFQEEALSAAAVAEVPLGASPLGRVRRSNIIRTLVAGTPAHSSVRHIIERQLSAKSSNPGSPADMENFFGHAQHKRGKRSRGDPFAHQSADVKQPQSTSAGPSPSGLVVHLNPGQGDQANDLALRKALLPIMRDEGLSDSARYRAVEKLLQQYRPDLADALRKHRDVVEKTALEGFIPMRAGYGPPQILGLPESITREDMDLLGAAFLTQGEYAETQETNTRMVKWQDIYYDLKFLVNDREEKLNRQTVREAVESKLRPSFLGADVREDAVSDVFYVLTGSREVKELRIEKSHVPFALLSASDDLFALLGRYIDKDHPLDEGAIFQAMKLRLSGQPVGTHAVIHLVEDHHLVEFIHRAMETAGITPSDTSSFFEASSEPATLDETEEITVLDPHDASFHYRDGLLLLLVAQITIDRILQKEILLSIGNEHRERLILKSGFTPDELAQWWNRVINEIQKLEVEQPMHPLLYRYANINTKLHGPDQPESALISVSIAEKGDRATMTREGPRQFGYRGTEDLLIGLVRLVAAGLRYHLEFRGEQFFIKEVPDLQLITKFLRESDVHQVGLLVTFVFEPTGLTLRIDYDLQDFGAGHAHHASGEHSRGDHFKEQRKDVPKQPNVAATTWTPGTPVHDLGLVKTAAQQAQLTSGDIERGWESESDFRYRLLVQSKGGEFYVTLSKRNFWFSFPLGNSELNCRFALTGGLNIELNPGRRDGHLIGDYPVVLRGFGYNAKQQRMILLVEPQEGHPDNLDLSLRLEAKKVFGPDFETNIEIVNLRQGIPEGVELITEPAKFSVQADAILPVLTAERPLEELKQAAGQLRYYLKTLLEHRDLLKSKASPEDIAEAEKAVDDFGESLEIEPVILSGAEKAMQHIVALCFMIDAPRETWAPVAKSLYATLRPGEPVPEYWPAPTWSLAYDALAFKRLDPAKNFTFDGRPPTFADAIDVVLNEFVSPSGQYTLSWGSNGEFSVQTVNPDEFSALIKKLDDALNILEIEVGAKYYVEADRKAKELVQKSRVARIAVQELRSQLRDKQIESAYQIWKTYTEKRCVDAEMPEDRLAGVESRFAAIATAAGFTLKAPSTEIAPATLRKPTPRYTPSPVTRREPDWHPTPRTRQGYNSMGLPINLRFPGASIQGAAPKDPVVIVKDATPVGQEHTVYGRKDIGQFLKTQFAFLSEEQLAAIQGMTSREPSNDDLAGLKLVNREQALTVVIFARLLYEFEKLGQPIWKTARPLTIKFIQDPPSTKQKKADAIAQLSVALGERNQIGEEEPSGGPILRRIQELRAFYDNPAGEGHVAGFHGGTPAFDSFMEATASHQIEQGETNPRRWAAAEHQAAQAFFRMHDAVKKQAPVDEWERGDFVDVLKRLMNGVATRKLPKTAEAFLEDPIVVAHQNDWIRKLLEANDGRVLVKLVFVPFEKAVHLADLQQAHSAMVSAMFYVARDFSDRLDARSVLQRKTRRIQILTKDLIHRIREANIQAHSQWNSQFGKVAGFHGRPTSAASAQATRRAA